MPDGLITPELVLQVAEAAEDYVITPSEFSSIMGTLTMIFMGVAAVVLGNILILPVIKGFTKETGVKIPIYG